MTIYVNLTQDIEDVCAKGVKKDIGQQSFPIEQLWPVPEVLERGTFVVSLCVGRLFHLPK